MLALIGAESGADLHPQDRQRAVPGGRTRRERIRAPLTVRRVGTYSGAIRATERCMAAEALNSALAALQAESQSALVEFLETDLDIAGTMMGVALELSSIDPARSQATLARVASALENVRHLVGRVEDPATAAQLRSGADLLATYL
jgi:hypothetical protein